MKPLPHDLDAERAVLGSILERPDLFPDVAAALSPEDFYAGEHREVFEAMVEVDGRGEWAEPVGVVAELRRRGSAISALDVAKWAEDVPLPTSALQYAARVRRLASQRALAKRLSSSLDDALSDRSEPGLLAADASLSILEAVGHEVARAVPIGESVGHAIEAVEERGRGGDTGALTGFRGLDDLLGGLGGGQFVIVASRPGVGKSAFLGNIARNVAGSGLGVALFSLEMTTFEVVMRLLCSESGIPFDGIRAGRATIEEWRALTVGAEGLFGLPIHVVDRANVRLPEVRAIARRTPGLGLVVVDYLQLMRPARNRDRREQEVAEISQGLKLLARELDVPVLAACQLNRDPEKRQDKRPQLADLRESGSLEQDADVVILLYRDSSDPAFAEAIVAKHRNGPTDTVKLTFRRDLTRFEPRY